MKVCYWGTFERDYPRNAVLISGLRQNGIEVIECHFALWKESFRYNKLALLSGFVNRLRFLGRVLLAYPILICRYLLLGEHDAVVVGYLGHIDMFFLAPFAKLKRKPIIFDAFFSLNDTAISDWGLAPKQSLIARLCHFIDRRACRLATVVLVDTAAQKEFFCREFGLDRQKVGWLYVGAEDAWLTPTADLPGRNPLRVIYVGNYVPLHGVPIILQAARLLAGEAVEFWLIGENHRHAAAHPDLAADADTPAVRLFPWMPPEQLRIKMAEADICLGIFGTSEKAKRVIPGKAYLALAMGKPLITGDSSAARELLEDGENAILCEMGSADALASAIRRLQRDCHLRQRIGEKGRKLFQDHCRPEILGSRFVHFIQATLKKGETVGH